MTVFCGCGDYDRRRNAIIVPLPNGRDIEAGALRAGAPKHTLILDCFRGIHQDVSPEDLPKPSKPNLAPEWRAEPCRQFYDLELERCEPGIVVMYSSSVGGLAGDGDHIGGSYAYSLVDCARRWSAETFVDTAIDYKVLSVGAAHAAAVSEVGRLSGNRQKPPIEPPRLQRRFPFAIVA